MTYFGYTFHTIHCVRFVLCVITHSAYRLLSVSLSLSVALALFLFFLLHFLSSLMVTHHQNLYKWPRRYKSYTFSFWIECTKSFLTRNSDRWHRFLCVCMSVGTVSWENSRAKKDHTNKWREKKANKHSSHAWPTSHHQNNLYGKCVRFYELLFCVCVCFFIMVDGFIHNLYVTF